MAVACAGVTVTWAGTSFNEVTDLNVTYGGSYPLSRGSTATPFALDLGTIEIACLGTVNVSASQYGKRGTLSISGGGMTFTSKCVYQSFKLLGKTNDVTKASVTFKIAVS